MDAAILRLRATPRRLRLALVVAAFAGLGLALFLRPPIFHVGPRAYSLADARTLLGVPNALNVLSNAFFAWAGWVGWRRSAGIAPALRPAARLAFASIAVVAVGSSVYHWSPGPLGLLVDRLPITLAFAALFAWVLGDRLGPRWATLSLAPLCLAALGALLLWFDGGDGGGDLRPYVLVQALPLACIPMLLALFPGELDARRFGLALGLYLVAKVCELFDHQIYALGELASGHTLKHLFAAAACGFLAPPRSARD